ncbi:DUF1292 domain-containing protein [Thermoflavimicrobium daqui]|jgi:uncharacterized protein YrzB (UPF0473 family)|uniref:UPF0473 protein DL897_06760 n=1 Tax=Thermoflavimicrobium daqui TaxID=2137476 RepID=A0A364K6F5_9BACL|nr:DUF1292 domain-containing protein [Thermoflavimicrobium daqui]RAL25770.1 DUF1292 domain-containing protein [Thermoflavimicrobium daqui]
MTEKKQGTELVETIVLDTEDGKKEEFQVLGYFELKETGKKYVLLTHEDTQNEDGEQDVFAYRYYEEGENITLEEIESDEEWNMVEETLNTLVDEEVI